MNQIWHMLPIGFVHLILEYNENLKLRNGKYMNQLCDLDTKYHLIVERMRFERYRKYYRDLRISFVDIHIPNTPKSIYYMAIHRGLRVTLHTEGRDGEILYSTIT